VAAEPAQQVEPLAQALGGRVGARRGRVQQRQRLVRRGQLRLQHPRRRDRLPARAELVHRGPVAAGRLLRPVQPQVQRRRPFEQVEPLVQRHRLRQQPALLEALGGRGVVEQPLAVDERRLAEVAALLQRVGGRRVVAQQLGEDVRRPPVPAQRQFAAGGGAVLGEQLLLDLPRHVPHVPGRTAA
jgi:hypothetical protein